MISITKRSTAQHTKKDKKFCSIIQPSLLEQILSSQALGKDRMWSKKGLNDVTFRIKEENSSKKQFVPYDTIKPFFEPPPTSNVPTRNKPKKFQSTQDIADNQKLIDGTLIHDDLSFLPAPWSIFTPKPAVRRPTASITTSRITPITSPTPVRREVTRSPPVFSRSTASEQPSPHTKNDVAIQSPTIPQIDIQPLIPDNYFLHERQSPCDNVTEIMDAAARNLRGTPPANTSTMQF